MRRRLRAGAIPATAPQRRRAEVGTVELDTAQRARIHVEKVAPETFSASVTTTGTVAFNGDRSTQVLAPISGPVSRILVSPGARVERGQPLAIVSSPDFAAAVAVLPQGRGARGATRSASPSWTSSSSTTTRWPGASWSRPRPTSPAAAADRDAALQQLRSLGVDEAAIDEIREGKPVAAGEGAIRAPIAGTVVEKLITPGPAPPGGHHARASPSPISRPCG